MSDQYDLGRYSSPSNSHHEDDYYTFGRGSLWTFLHLPLLLGGGASQGMVIFFMFIIILTTRRRRRRTTTTTDLKMGKVQNTGRCACSWMLRTNSFKHFEVFRDVQRGWGLRSACHVLSSEVVFLVRDAIIQHKVGGGQQVSKGTPRKTSCNKSQT